MNKKVSIILIFKIDILYYPIFLFTKTCTYIYLYLYNVKKNVPILHYILKFLY